MIKITIIAHSEDGKIASPVRVSMDYSDHVHTIEFQALWDAIRNGRFERQAKTLFEKFCADRRLDASKLL